MLKPRLNIILEIDTKASVNIVNCYKHVLLGSYGSGSTPKSRGNVFSARGESTGIPSAPGEGSGPALGGGHEKARRRNEACFGDAAEPALDDNFDFEGNLALFDKRAIWASMRHSKVSSYMVYGYFVMPQSSMSGTDKYHSSMVSAGPGPDSRRQQVPARRKRAGARGGAARRARARRAARVHGLRDWRGGHGARSRARTAQAVVGGAAAPRACWLRAHHGGASHVRRRATSGGWGEETRGTYTKFMLCVCVCVYLCLKNFTTERVNQDLYS